MINNALELKSTEFQLSLKKIITARDIPEILVRKASRLPTPQKRTFFWGGSVLSNIFFNFRDMIMIQNMENIKSTFQIDLEYFGQHLVNTDWFSGKSNSRILEKS